MAKRLLAAESSISFLDTSQPQRIDGRMVGLVTLLWSRGLSNIFLFVLQSIACQRPICNVVCIVMSLVPQQWGSIKLLLLLLFKFFIDLRNNELKWRPS